MRTFIVYSTLGDIKSKRIRSKAHTHIATVYKRRAFRRWMNDQPNDMIHRSSIPVDHHMKVDNESATSRPHTSDNEEENAQLAISAIDDIYSGTGYAVNGTDWQVFNTDFLSKSAEYFFSIVGPASVWNPQNTPLAFRTEFRNACFGLFLNEQSLLLSIALVGQAYIDRLHASSGLSPTDLGPRLKLRTISLVRNCIFTMTNVSDGLLFTVAALMVASSLYQDWPAFEVNFHGLEKLVEVRGGAEAVGYYDFFKSFLGWAKLRENIPAGNPDPHTPQPQLTYPDHPFSSELCSILTKYPPGVRELALSQVLSHQVLDYTDQLSSWLNNNIHHHHEPSRHDPTRHVHHEREDALLTQLLSLLNQPLKPREHTFCIGLFGLLISADGPALRTTGPRGPGRYLIGLDQLLPLTTIAPCTPDLLWATVVVAATADGYLSNVDPDWFLAARLLRLSPSDPVAWKTRRPGWSEVGATMRDFFWSATLEVRGRRAWGRVCSGIEHDGLGSSASAQLCVGSR